jgi:hypothetical protein
LVQGELLGPLWEYVPTISPVELPESEDAVPVQAVLHEWVVLVTPDCDLEQDYRLRFPDGWTGAPADIDEEPGAVPHLVMCDLFIDLRSRVAGGDIFKRARKNQDERYHTFPAVPVAETGTETPELFGDFRRSVSLPTRFVYDGIRGGGVHRRALLPEIHRLDFAHRFFGYQSRIPVP